VKKKAKARKAAKPRPKPKPAPRPAGEIPDGMRRRASLTKAAHELNLGKRHVQDLAKEGMPKANARGIYYIDDCLRWYVRYLQNKLKTRGAATEAEPGSPAASAKHQLLEIDLELKQIDLAARREELIPIDVVKKDFAGLVVEIRTRILSLPPRLAAEVLGETDLAVSQVKIDKSLKRALEALSKYEPGATS
jgi:hypothetical protein